MTAPSFFRSRIAILAAALAVMAGCRSVYYGAMEQFGFEKRDLLRRAVKAVGREQEQTGKQFEDALAQLKAIYGYDGGNLERAYDKLKAEYDDCAVQVDLVDQRITEMERVSRDLFSEWKSEIGDITDRQLASASRAKLEATRQRANELSRSLRQTQAALPPVLRRLHDQVLFVKHNLNAEALGSLRGHADAIQGDIASIIDRMNRTSAEADAFITTLK